MINPVTRLPRQNKPLSIRNFLGMDTTGTRDVRRSPNMLNCILDDEGTPEMRCGYEKLFETSLGAGAILGIHQWIATNGAITYIVHHGTKLYTFSTLGDQPTLVYTGLNGLHKSVAFMLATKLCIIGDGKFIVYDGLTFVDALTIAYIPTFLIGTPPTGGGTRTEDLNLLQPRWKQKCSTVDSVLMYQLYGAPLGALEYLWINGALKTLTTDYSVNVTTGLITLVANPGAGTNNLEVQVRKDSAIDTTRITKCTIAKVYGGPSDSRVFLTGNPDYPHIDWWTGLPLSGAYDPTYWPDTNYDRIGGDTDPIVGYAVQQDRMIVLKRRSIYLRYWELTTDTYNRTAMRFPSVIIHSAFGAVSGGSCQPINNNPFFLSNNGMQEIQATVIRDERNVSSVSPLVNIAPSGSMESIDFNGKYYLALADGVVWICDYNRMVKDEATGRYAPVWYPWDSLPVSVWAAADSGLLFGASGIGMIYRMKTTNDALPYNDDGNVINAHFSSVFTVFDRDNQTKLVQNMIIGMKPAAHSELLVEYATEEGYSGIVHIEKMDLATFEDMDFDNFSFETSRVSKSFNVRIDDARGVQRFQSILRSSGEVNDFFGFSSIDIVYQILSEVRF